MYVQAYTYVLHLNFLVDSYGLDRTRPVSSLNTRSQTLALLDLEV